MDTFILISLILGILESSHAQGAKMLRCIQCDHIGWNMTYNFPGVQNVYQILQSKYNPACTATNPRDPSAYNQNYENQQNQQQFQNQNPQQPGNNFFQNRNDITDTICPVKAETNRCNYVFGLAYIYLSNYDSRMTLSMHTRNCFDAAPSVENGCYHRDTQYGYYELKDIMQNKLQFLGGPTLERFVGTQCYCNTDLCYPYISSSRNVVASWFSLIFASVALIVLN